MAALAFGLAVPVIVSVALGTESGCPIPEGPPLANKKLCWDYSEESKDEKCITTPHEVFYKPTNITGDSYWASGDWETVTA